MDDMYYLMKLDSKKGEEKVYNLVETDSISKTIMEYTKCSLKNHEKKNDGIGLLGRLKAKKCLGVNTSSTYD